MLTVPTAPIIFVRFEQNAIFEIKSRDAIGSSAHSLSGGLSPTISPISVDLVLLSEFGISNCGNGRRRYCRLKTRTRIFESENHGSRVRRRNLIDSGDKSTNDCRRSAPYREQSIKRRPDCFSVEGRSILKTHAVAEMESPSTLVTIWLPRLCEGRNVLISRSRLQANQCFKHRRQHATRCSVIRRVRVEISRSAIGGDDERRHVGILTN